MGPNVVPVTGSPCSEGFPSPVFRGQRWVSEAHGGILSFFLRYQEEIQILTLSSSLSVQRSFPLDPFRSFYVHKTRSHVCLLFRGARAGSGPLRAPPPPPPAAHISRLFFAFITFRHDWNEAVSSQCTCACACGTGPLGRIDAFHKPSINKHPSIAELGG